MELVSIICPAYNEEPFIETCIQSVLAQDLPREQWELLIVDGGSNDKTRTLISPYLKQYANIRLLDNPHRTAPYAMNIGIEQARGVYVVRIDAHSIFPTNYISTLIHYLTTLPNAANVGVSCVTLAANDTMTARAIAFAQSHHFGVGNSVFRTQIVKQPTLTDTVPFGCWQKTYLETIGVFDVELTRNQDDELNARIIKSGGSIYLVPGLTVKYYARDTLIKTAAMFYQYGLFKPLVNRKTGSPATIRQFVPLLFVSGLIIGLPLCFLSKAIAVLYGLCVLTYMIIDIAIAIRNSNPMLLPVFPCMHLSYGWGYLTGIMKIIFNRPFTVTSNR